MSWLNDYEDRLRLNPELLQILGVILYTDRHANIKQVLANQDYWNAFDLISGPRWAVAATRVLPGRMETRGGGGPGGMGFLIAHWVEPFANKQILAQFNLTESSDAPCILIYMPAEGGNMKCNFIELDDSSIDAAQKSIADNLKLIADVIKTQDREGVLDTPNVFEAINSKIKSISKINAIST